MPLIVIAIGVGLVVLAHTAPFPFLLEWLGPGRSIWHQPSADGVPTIYLTYDDGPNPAATPALLDVLGREGATATFFVIPKHITDETAPILRRIHDEGHAVALHSHTRALMLASPEDLASHLRTEADRIERISGGSPCALFRPHAGWRGGQMYAGLDRADYRLAGWSFAMWDWNWWRPSRPQQLASRLAGRASDGDIVVMHDGHHENPRADRARTVKATAELIPLLRKKGFGSRGCARRGESMTAASPRFNAASHFVDRHIVEGRGDSIAIECGDRRITYRELYEQVNRVGAALRDTLDVRPEERVLLLTLDGPEMIYAFFGAIKIGAVPVPLNTLWTVPDYEHVLQDAGARVIIISSGLYPRVIDAVRRSATVRHVVVVGDECEPQDHRLDHLMRAASAELTAPATHRDAPCFWLYSSGSTGPPKACVHLQHDMSVCAESYAQGVLGIHERDRCFSVAKLFFAYGLGNAMYFPLAVGATTILWPGPVAPPVIYDLVERYRPTLFFSVPTHYAMLLSHAGEREFDLSSIRCAVSAGEALPPAVFERFRDRFGLEILDGIGSTEALHIFISNQAGRIRPGSSGVTVPGYEARITDEQGLPVARGEIGDLAIRGDSTCALYWNRHEQTKDTIAGHWIRTGDKYRQDEDGFFWFAGRSDDMLKVGGIWVSPAEVEHTLLEHPAVQACGVAGRGDKDGLMKPVAFVVLRTGHSANTDLAHELQQFARTRLAEYKRPRWIAFLDALPTTATGKIQRFKLRELGVTLHG